MPISAASLEAAIHNAIPVKHLEIKDDSDGCGDKYTVLIVSEVGHISPFEQKLAPEARQRLAQLLIGR